jgi:hypothetical protein
MGPGPYDIQITDVFGQKMSASGVALAVTTEIDLGQQFPAVAARAGRWRIDRRWRRHAGSARHHQHQRGQRVGPGLLQ